MTGRRRPAGVGCREGTDPARHCHHAGRCGSDPRGESPPSTAAGDAMSRRGWLRAGSRGSRRWTCSGQPRAALRHWGDPYVVRSASSAAPVCGAVQLLPVLAPRPAKSAFIRCSLRASDQARNRFGIRRAAGEVGTSFGEFAEFTDRPRFLQASASPSTLRRLLRRDSASAYDAPSSSRLVDFPSTQNEALKLAARRSG
jgi:hypothetical protein